LKKHTTLQKIICFIKSAFPFGKQLCWTVKVVSITWSGRWDECSSITYLYSLYVILKAAQTEVERLQKCSVKKIN